MALSSPIRSYLVPRSFLSAPRCLQVRLQQTLTSAYVFHPNIQTTEADKQMYIWTKTIPIEAPPIATQTLMREVDLEPIRRIMETTILMSRLYEKREVKKKSKKKPKDVTRGTHENFPSTLLKNQFKNVVGFAKHYPQLRNLNPASETPVCATWRVQDEVLSVHGKPGTFLNSKKPMPQFYVQELVEESKTIPVDSLGPISPFTDLNKYLIKDRSSTGLSAEKSFYPHFHTLFVEDNGEYIPPPSKGLPDIQLIQKGLLFTFGRLLAQAVTKHGNGILGSVLPEPECAQSIMTDGNTFMFLWYQLNTLDMSDLGSGVKNIACIQRPKDMFETIEVQPKRRHCLTGVNEEVLRLYLSMLLMS